MKYIKGKGYFVGSFSETDIKNGLDRVAVEKAKAETGLQYTNQEYIKKGGIPVGIKLYVCSLNEMHI